MRAAKAIKDLQGVKSLVAHFPHSCSQCCKDVGNAMIRLALWLTSAHQFTGARTEVSHELENWLTNLLTEEALFLRDPWASAMLCAGCNCVVQGVIVLCTWYCS